MVSSEGNNGERCIINKQRINNVPVVPGYAPSSSMYSYIRVVSVYIAVNNSYYPYSLYDT